MNKTLADILGWEEGATYKVGELYYSVVGENLYYFKDFESSRIKFYQDTIIDLLDLVNEAEKVELKRYYLKHKFLGEGVDSYLNYNYQTQFTDDEIEEIKATGFDLCNFEREEVEDE